MMHMSVPIEHSCEIINVTKISPLISKCDIKVCYVSDQPNRNGSIITKEVATKLADTLRGNPIVGFYSEANQDFEEHNRIITISNGTIHFEDATKPYGFIDLNAKVWFQKFLDDGEHEREYLMTEGWLWTGQYPECERIITNGNNQSMELDDKTIDGTWTKINNQNREAFIINNGLISKLCVLGENFEPCFEGAQITKTYFSLDQSFANQLYSMMTEMKQLLCEGGIAMNEENIALNETAFSLDTESETEFKKKPDDEEEKKDSEKKQDNSSESDSDNSDKTTDASNKAESKENDSSEEESSKDDEEEEEKEKKKKTYSLQEYDDLKREYEILQNSNAAQAVELTTLQNETDTLKANYCALQEQYQELLEFKHSVELQQKQDMINSFYMLSDEEKQDVVSNISNYSLDEIEAKLAIICVRNKVSFTDPIEEDNVPMTYNFNGTNSIDTSNEPEWVLAVKKHMEEC